MKYLAILIIATVALAGLETGIAIGFSVDNDVEQIPMLSLGYSLGGHINVFTHVAGVGYSDGWEMLAFGGLGIYPIQIGVCYDGERVGSYVGFDAALTENASVISRVMSIEDSPTYAVTGLCLAL